MSELKQTPVELIPAEPKTETQLLLEHRQHWLTEIRRGMRHAGADAFLLTDASSFDFTGFRGSVPQDKNREAFAIVTQDSVHVFARQLYDSEDKLGDVWDEARMGFFPDTLPWDERAREFLREHDLSTLAVEGDSLTLFEAQRFDRFGVRALSLESLRREKTPYDIEIMRQAAEITDKTYVYVADTLREWIAKGQTVTERSVRDLIDNKIADLGGKPSFETIVAFGSNAASPHYETGQLGEVVLQNHQEILLDFGALYKGRCSDTTKMLFNNPTPEQIKAYETVVAANKAAIDYIRSEYEHWGDVNAARIDNVARGYITEHGYEPYPHRTGHSIGREVHESPDIKQYPPDQPPVWLGPGSVFTIEPGIYRRDGSTRFEEDVALTVDEQGRWIVKVLTQASSKLIDLAENSSTDLTRR